MSETYEERQARLAPLNAELAALNAEVDAVIAKRTAWMDAHMKDYATVQIGEVAYDRDGRCYGVVAEHYRYWRNRDPRYDTSVNVEYVFQSGTNTSGSNIHAAYLITEPEYRARELAKAQRLVDEHNRAKVAVVLPSETHDGQ